MRRITTALWISAALAVGGCAPSSNPGSGDAITQATHIRFFPINDGTNHALNRAALDGPIACMSCHTNAQAFAEYTCTGCHEHPQPIMDMLHVSVAMYRYASDACYSCHPAGARQAFDHLGVTSGCVSCHDDGTLFAATPSPRGDANHPPLGPPGSTDCAGCHNTTAWLPASGAPNNKSDPSQNFGVLELIPSFVGPSIQDPMSMNTEVFTNVMNHSSTTFPANLPCITCHVNDDPDAGVPVFFPGVFHSSLDLALIPQPTACSDCHASDRPTGFVGTNAGPVRSPDSGEMRHEAVLWSGGMPTATAIVTQDCSVCHVSPSATVNATWQTNALFHASLGMQPGSCIDCHANTRPKAPVLVAPNNVVFDHQSPDALGDCATCHKATSGTWNDGKFHDTSPAPASCVDCHAAERPTTGAAPSGPPFDYGTNSSNITHGDGLDCVTCHAGSASTKVWSGGQYVHEASAARLAPSDMTCVACHSSQRPVMPVSGFDHALNGTGDCYGCHQATHAYAAYTADWMGGQQYPGDVLTSAADQFIVISEVKLTRTGGDGGFVTGSTTTSTTLYNAMWHTSPQIPAAIAPGPAGAPDQTTCWHCHTSTSLPDGGHVVTQFINGQFHPALSDAGFSQPSSGCKGCHSGMIPAAIVEKGGSDLQAMDHGAPVGGSPVVPALDCSTCHKNPGVSWSDGSFHAKISGTPNDCVGCHWPLMADAARADVTNAALYKMTHRSAQLKVEGCDTCHTSALMQATGTTASLFATGAYHANVGTQPALCNDCHTVSLPPSSAPTQSSTSYTLSMGATATNQGQWMNHSAAVVAGKDCAVCHLADAKASGAAWSTSTKLHVSGITPTTCQNCHGLTNGGGSTVGTKNNMPAGLFSSMTVTTADSTTGVSGQHDQIDHADVNVTSHDCNFCHLQAGVTWSGAAFHANFTGGNALVMNGTTGRCSNCHLNVKPTAVFTAQDHSMFTDTSGSQDCSSCHGFPGLNGQPNWLGAAGAPTYITVGGFTIGVPPAAAGTTQAGINNLQHPSTSGLQCTSCHTSASGGKGAIGYDHVLAPSTGCSACHEAGSNLVGTAWQLNAPGAVSTPASCSKGNGSIADRAGDTRAVGVTSIACGDSARNKTAQCGSQNCSLNHFYPTDCSVCHAKPLGLVKTSTGTTFSAGWKFKHPSTGTQVPACCQCHSGTTNCSG
jgi:hypothetical protein